MYLEDILKSIRLVNNYSKRGYAFFKKNISNQDAIVRRVEIIGEAIKNVPVETKKKYKNIEWKKFEGIRNFIIHVYFGINIDRVWKLIKNDLPTLEEQMKAIKKDF